jgi:N-acetylneuraminic acid mutarotase
MFGGYCRGAETYYDTLYMFESETLTWSKIEPKGIPPERRCGHSASVVDGKIWIFGGRVKTKKTGFWDSERAGVVYKNDLHCYDPVTNEWYRYEPRGIGPSGRSLHTATVVGRKIYIFGGANSSGNRNDTSGFCDLYELDIDTLCWTECETHNTPPTPCYGHSATYIGDDRILYFGGKGYQVLNSIHVLHLKTLEWRQYAYAGNTLVPRWGHSASLHDSRILIYGGRAAHGYYNTMDFIDTAKHLIELKPEEQVKEKQKRKYEEKNKTSEALGNLQTSAAELTEMIHQIGEQILIQKKAIMETRNAMVILVQENDAIKKELERLHITPPSGEPVIQPNISAYNPTPMAYNPNPLHYNIQPATKPQSVIPTQTSNPEAVIIKPTSEQQVGESKIPLISKIPGPNTTTSTPAISNSEPLRNSNPPSFAILAKNNFPPPSAPLLYGSGSKVESPAPPDEELVSY